LQRLLRELRPRQTYTVINRGLRSSNLSYFTNNLESLIELYQPKVVILNINNRVSLEDRNIFLSNRELLSLSGWLRIHAGAFFENFKVYKVFRILAERVKKRGDRIPEMRPSREESGNVSGYVSDIEICKRKVRENPLDIRARRYLAGAYFAQGLTAQSAEITAQIIEREPGNGWNYVDLFWDYVFLNDYSRALEAQKKALSLTPQIRDTVLREIEALQKSPSGGSAPDIFILADKFALLGDYEEALRRCREALQRYPFCVEFYDKMTFYTWALGHRPGADVSSGGSVSGKDYAGSFFLEDANQPWAFIESLEQGGGLFRENVRKNGYEIFYRLLRYDLKKAAEIARRKGVRIVLENMGSCVQQQAVIQTVCRELDVPLADLFAAFRDDPHRDRYFNPRLTLRLNSEGSLFMAEHILRVLQEKGIL
jgi:tetratricopeptide (TPR) repeat protein